MRWLPIAAAVCLLSAPAARAASDAPPLSPLQAAQLQAVCSRCHARPDSGAPLMGDGAAWAERNAAGFAVLLRHTVDGWRTMPPLGTCGSCSEADLRVLVAIVSGLPDPQAAR